MRKYQLNRCTCLRCGHSWTPRREIVKICPKCKSAGWDTTTDGTPRASGIRAQGGKVWFRVSDTYTKEQREQAIIEAEAFLRWLNRDTEVPNG